MSSKKYTNTAERKKVLNEIRRAKMARSSHAYVRGSTHLFYEWLKRSVSVIPKGPTIWICGDCHMGNLGPIANAKGEINIEIRDFDQSVIGNPAHDLIRLGLSLASTARGSDLPGIITVRMVETLIEGYLEAFAAENKGQKNRAISKPKLVKAAIKTALSRTWTSMAKENIVDAKPDIPLGKRFWPLSKEEKKEMQVLFSQDRIRRMVTSLRRRDSESDIKVLDAAFWVKGCSSLGNLRYAALLEIEGDEKEYCLIDIKEAITPVAPGAKRAKMPKDQSERVATGAWHMSPALGDRIIAAHFLGRPVFLRELLPQDLKFEMEHLELNEAIEVAKHLAFIVGKAHARQMQASDIVAWQNELRKHPAKGVGAPAWLWTSIVDLIVLHERAYLEHCRGC